MKLFLLNDDKINLRLKNMIHPTKSPDVLMIPKDFGQPEAKQELRMAPHMITILIYLFLSHQKV